MENGYNKISIHKMLTRPALLSNSPLETVKYLGYKFNDVIVSCVHGSFDKTCNESDASLYIHPDMFNCYTLKMDSTEIGKPGSRHGLSLILYIGIFLQFQPCISN